MINKWETWASMPLVEDADQGAIAYGARPKYRIEAGTVIHHGDRAYFPLIPDSDKEELLQHSDVHTLTDSEVKELEQRLPYPLPSPVSQEPAINPKGKMGLGDLIAKVTHFLGIRECGGCRKRRRWFNRISIDWPPRK
jgi:hypothetical protein